MTTIGTRRPSNSIVAAASQRTLDQVRSTPVGQNAEGLWELYDRLGELGYGVGFKSNAAARLTYYPAVQTDSDEPTEIDTGPAKDAFDRIQGPAGDLGDMVSELVVHLDVPGEGFLVGQTTTEDPDGELWDVWSADELKKSGGSTRQNPDTVFMEDTDPFILRIWRPHPRDRAIATSPLQHVREVAERLILIRGALDAAMRSRLMGKLLMIPDELTIVSNTQLPDDGAEADGDPFFNELIQTIITSIKEEKSAARVAPILLRGPGDRLMQIQALDLVRDLPEKLMDMETAAVRALAAGMDLPAEILLGLGDVNHWTAWMVDESAYRQHVDPIVQTILDSITRGFLWPALRTSGMPETEVRTHLLWRDISPVTVRTVTIMEAIELYDRRIINAEAVRTDAGYSEEEAGDPDELKPEPEPDIEPVGPEEPTDEQLPPDMEETITAAVEASFANLALPPATTTTGTSAVVLTGLARIDRGLMDKISEAAQAALDRSLERAGAKIRSHAAKDRAVTDKISPASVTNLQVAAVLGPDIVHRLQLNDEDLIPTDSFDRLGVRVDRLLENAQTQTAVEVEKLTGAPARRDETEEKTWRSKAVALLVSGMVALGLSRLFKPDAAPDPSETGEIGDTLIPANLVRDTLTVAGGNLPADIPDTARGLALGDNTQRTLRDAGLVTTGYVWEYGDPSSRKTNFEPHQNLDGVEFETWTDSILAAFGSWVGVSHFFPGDHKGCRCQNIPKVEVT